MDVSLNKDEIGLMVTIERETGAKVRDCMIDDGSLVCIIEKGYLGAAIGRGGSNIKRLSSMSGKTIRMVEFDPDPAKFASKFLDNRHKGISLKGDATLIISSNQADKGSIIGRDGKNIKLLSDLLERHHGITKVMVK